MSRLPGIAGEIEAVIGLERTMLLLRRRGGTEINIPVRARGSMLAEIIGVDGAEAMIRAFGSAKIMLPCGHLRGTKARRAEAKKMLRAGASISQVALACDMHSRTVSNYRAQLEAEAGRRQLDLPFDND
ncbi:helix-turn-helix domain-containing protein [Defluviimonas sp. WL0024]|uniref:Helix-turn-helix domain-containing protein n=1 Tax=Albidovulum salinarum TaxID=2984153 RepID=A0ABT2X8U8_9RHOB|nr:helix-turn-helix domain-containing protein [Defluviimonas sp. WL0024]MCU9850367.1 helix-turn-helix domain-containing protein [Defluviimonas sp. WL0024]